MPTMILTEAPPVEERRGYAVLYETPEADRRIGVVVATRNEWTIVTLETTHTSLADEPEARHWCVPLAWVKAWIGPVRPPVPVSAITFR
jgi:hypothetical protein